jgi:hypothetical protein
MTPGIKKTDSSGALRVRESQPREPATSPDAKPPQDAKARLESGPKRLRASRASLTFLRPRRNDAARRSLDAGVASRHGEIDRARQTPQGRHDELDDILREAGFAFVGGKDARAKWDARRTANPEKASDKGSGKPDAAVEASAANPPPPRDAPPPPQLRLAAPALVPRSALSDLLAPLPGVAPSAAAPVSKPLPGSPQQPTQVQLGAALGGLEVVPTRPNESAFTRLAHALDEGLAPLGRADEAVIDAKKRLREAERQVDLAAKKRFDTHALKVAKAQFQEAQARVTQAQAQRDSVATWLHAFAAGKLDAGRARAAVDDAKHRVDSAQARVTLLEQKADKSRFDGRVREELKLARRLLVDARLQFQAADEFHALTDGLLDDTKKQQVFGHVPAATRGLADVLFRMNSANPDRNAWIVRVSGDLPEGAAAQLGAVLAPGGSIVPRLQLFLKDLLEGVTKGDPKKLQGTQRDIEVYLGEGSALFKNIDQALAVLDGRTDPEATELRDDLRALLEALRDPQGPAQQLLLVARTEPERLMAVATQLWVPTPGDRPPPLPPRMPAPPTA